MSFTRRTWFLHRVLPAGAVMAAGSLGAGGVSVAAAAGSGGGHVDRRTGIRVALDRKQRLHPALQYGAQADPERRVRVVVQLRHRNQRGDEVARTVGATHKRAFAAFKSHALEVKQKHLPLLARHPHVAYITPDARLRVNAIATTSLQTAHIPALGLPQLWNGPLGLTGAGVTVAVLDTGINRFHPDLRDDVTAIVVNARSTGWTDAHGHGTHVASLITGRDPQGRYLGVAPDARVVSVQIADDQGMSLESDLLSGLEWIERNQSVFNIRAVNLSISGAMPQPYATGPINAAVELLWGRGITVVVSAGNRGGQADAVQYAPANDPFVITVGALDDNQTPGLTDDSLAPFSSRGLTLEGIAKPDVLAPGRRIVGALARSSATLAQQLPERIVDPEHIRLSGTSMAAPVVTGVIALLLQKYPTLTPDQVKWLLTRTMRTYPGQVGAAGVVDPQAAIDFVASNVVGAANQGQALNTRLAAILAEAGVQSTSSYWDSSYWDSSYWDSSYWDSSYWDSSYWDAAASFDAANDDPVSDTYPAL
jgi:serine protease AprX